MSVLRKKKDFIEQYKNLSGKGSHPKWMEFVGTFFESAPSSALEETAEDKQLSLQLKSSWEAFLNSKMSHNAVSIIYDYQELTGKLTLTIIQPDQPFLVETLKTHIASYHLKSEGTFHPIFSVKRDLKTGAIIDFSSIKQKLPLGYNLESLISVEISWGLSSSMVSKFIDELTWRFQMLQLSIQDWPKMRQTISRVVPRSHHQEWDYFDWLFQDNFIFVGFREVTLSQKGKVTKSTSVKETALGLFKDSFYDGHKAFEAQGQKSKQNLIFTVNKTSVRSPINRSARLDMIEIKDKKENRVYQVIGIFTRRSYNTSIFSIPILRKKAEHVFESFGVQRTWHDGKLLLQALESISHDEYWHLSEENLHALCEKVMGFHEKSLPVFTSHPMENGKSQTLIIFIGRERYSIHLKESLAKALVQNFGGEISSTRGIVDDAPFARIIYVLEGIKQEISHNQVEKVITENSLTWDEKRLALSKTKVMNDPFVGVFTEDYQYDFTPEQAVLDGGIIHTVGIRSNYGMRVEFSQTVLEETFSSNVSLRLFSLNRPLGLTPLLDILQNFGINVAQEKTYALKNGLYYLHNCIGTIPSSVMSEAFAGKLSEIVEKTLEEIHPNDAFNKLFTLCGFNQKQVQVFRGLFAYTRQLRYTYDQKFFVSTLIEHGDASKILLNWFEAKFDPALSNTKRTKIIGECRESLAVYMEQVTNSVQDQLFQDVRELVDAMVRTNYFLDREVLSFKFECSKISKMPEPRPHFETYVSAFHVEGVHLRTSKVARGGIRHSDRFQDYRSEVLQLMQAQDLKNSIIVPTGAKGGFVVKVKNPTKDDVVVAYKTFISSLLDLADNIQGGKIVHPKGIVAHDGEDPYLVVAADKGTATFSDIANGLAKDYGFWLGDAFASGGSQGYDHKKLGITAKGAFVSVAHHFAKLGVDISKEPITVVGVGDMSGDVFGNGLLEHPTLRLVGAFNHKHIFIDPNPDLNRSYLERKRLFDLPSSGWNDYNQSLISKGGGIFNRNEKILNVSKEIQDLFGVNEKVTPDALIRGILGFKADLLWFGGIGTYIRGNEEVYQGDNANDPVRMTSEMIQARVIGEGANLGVTPLARIELGLKGVIVNSDAIDNAGGVNCSDNEVNLKILVGTESTKARDALLENLEKEVASHVLLDNKKQNIALDVMASDGRERHYAYVDLINLFERQGQLKRKTVFLEKDDVLRHQRRSLTRSEHAVILSFSKNAMQKLILEHFDILKSVASPFVQGYFPKTLEGKGYMFENHMLYREIAALSMTDAAINFMGPLWFFEHEDQAAKRARLFVTLFDAWGLRSIFAHMLYDHPEQVVEKLADVRRVLTTAMAFFKEGVTIADFNKAKAAYLESFGVEAEFSEYPYLLALSSQKISESELKDFFELRGSLKLGELYEAIFALPEDESWQLPQKYKLINDLFERHVSLIRGKYEDLNIVQSIASLQTHSKDYGFASYVIDAMK